MFIFPLNKLRCWQVGQFGFLTDGFRPFPGSLVALSKGLSTTQSAKMNLMPALVVLKSPWIPLGGYTATTVSCCQSTTLAPEGPVTADSLHQTFCLPALVNFRWPCSHFYPGQMGGTSPDGPTDGLWLLEHKPSLVWRACCDWCRYLVMLPF
jgi:hypothetical protein